MMIRTLARKLPGPVKKGLKYTIAPLPIRFKYGKVFWETYNFLQMSQEWSKERLEEYQVQMLHSLIRHAYENVAYYRKIFDENGIRIEDIQEPHDLRRLPFLTKETLKKEACDGLLASNFMRKELVIAHTSGTTGKPIQFFEDILTGQKERAFIYHQWSRMGFKPGDARVELRGMVSRKKPFAYDPLERVLRFSPVLDDKETAISYLRKMSSFGARFLHGYPGAIYSFAMLVKDKIVTEPISMKAIFFASETVYPWQRELVKEVFKCRVFSHYGLTEKVMLASECEKSEEYHCIPQYGITEIDSDTGELIGTGFLNYATPMIRYRTTDIVSLPTSSKCEKCGRSYYPVFKNVEGRIEDFIITPKGALISPATITHPFKDLKTVVDSQVIQTDLNTVVVRAVPLKDVAQDIIRKELSMLCEDISAIFGGEIKVSWEIVDQIERLKSGKYKWIVSKLASEYLPG